MTTAERRIAAVFQKFGGAIEAPNKKALQGILVKKVFNRGRELGDYHNGDFATVIAGALGMMLASGIVKECDGHFGLMQATPAKRRHRQKYPRGRAA